ncbi:hypothetical protein K6119_18115 [Paracrocinitomix mangrovi]|uniref:hypothetical protein n=1 Tax=Paracrocinitomix mangrovi TaxID=2862509 RepID=UPI001C8DAFC3|nr:hypothetical protein [Paracrocinitomix mangrovi]UKN01641.1 hypothetical protein K6119_18115 [Paracrocinitomix mangrovi]
MFKFINFMKVVKKYASILVLLAVFPTVWIVGRSFITEPDTGIYDYIPQESDIVIEVNNVNFISEIIYQRIFHEEYVLDKIELEEVETKTGIDYLSRIVLFREQWANEHVWMAVIKYTDKDDFTAYVNSNLNKSNIAFGDEYAIIQLSSSDNQENLNDRLNKIANKDIKPFTARVDLRKYFKPENEINCYFIPPGSENENSIIDGHISFDFHQNHIDISGEFTPISEFENAPFIANQLDENVAFSLRSSLNILSSIYWFSNEKIEGVPSYNQMSLDYDGVNLYMVDFSEGLDIPFKSHPEMQLQFEFQDQNEWQAFLDTMVTNGQITLDTANNLFTTSQGTHFKYSLDKSHFNLYEHDINFKENKNSEAYFDLQIKVKPFIDNTTFEADSTNPPPDLIMFAGLSVVEGLKEDMQVLTNVDEVRFQLLKEEGNMIKADGLVQMTNRDGQSMIECLIFAKEGLMFITDAIEIMSDMTSSE